MLIDSFAPAPDAVEIHRITIRAPADAVYRALWTADLTGSPVVKGLLALRSLPTILMRRGARPSRRGRRVTLADVVGAGFGRLAEEPGREIVLGVAGRFWRPTGNLAPFREEAFRQPVPPGLAHAVWSFAVREADPGRTILSTETRVVCGDRASRAKFRAYWTVVRPFSGLIRILMLRAVRRECERPA